MDLVNYNGRGSKWRLFLPAGGLSGILSRLAACSLEAGLSAPSGAFAVEPVFSGQSLHTA